jgi:pSer/pThr/pTyr-binding forkhead associated (FHA) protein
MAFAATSPPDPERERALQQARAGVDPEQVAPDAPRVLAGFLVSYETSTLGSFWPIFQGRNAVGRKDAAEGLDISIDHPTTSSRHAALLASARPGRIKIEDGGSTNGTFVGDQRLEPGRRHELNDGDVIRFGGFFVLVKII